MELHFYFYILLIIISFLYASVGHGGASGYLALMAIFSFSPQYMKNYALVLNIIVSLISFSFYFSNFRINYKLFFALIITSIPMAYLGSRLPFSDKTYKIILGIILLIPALQFIFFQNSNEQTIPFKKYFALVIGAIIGFLSGMLGIGGGIILSPVLINLKWTHIKETASISSLFIFVNSISGLIGSKNVYYIQNQNLIYMIICVIIGGVLGAYLGAKILEKTTLKKILSIVLFIASFKLIFS